jgi:excisionase family DNA binding protein
LFFETRPVVPGASKLLDEWSEAPLQDLFVENSACFDAFFRTIPRCPAGESSVPRLPTGLEEGHMNAFTADGERVLSVHTVAVRLGVSDRTVRLWAKKGRLPSFKDGPKIWRFRASDVEAVRARLMTGRRDTANHGGRVRR